MSRRKPLDIVLALNESVPGAHVDVHRALERLRAAGAIGRSVVVPHVAVRGERGDAAAEAAVVSAAEEIGADAVLWSHTGDWRVRIGTVDALRARNVAMGYLDGDWYDAWHKPFPVASRALACTCDVAFVPGAGWHSRKLSAGGCARVEYVPLTTDERFMGGEHSATPEFDVVLVGNRVRSRMPLKTMPGARWREEIVDALSRRYGSRFTVFGNGWSGPNAGGPIPFEQQRDVYSSASVVVGVNNLRASYYFSNRLPIAMSCGAKTVHNWEPGLDVVFPDEVRPRLFTTTAEALVAVDTALEADFDPVPAREFADERVSMDAAMTYMVAYLDALSRRKTPQPNPWIGRPIEAVDARG